MARAINPSECGRKRLHKRWRHEHKGAVPATISNADTRGFELEVCSTAKSIARARAFRTVPWALRKLSAAIAEPDANDYAKCRNKAPQGGQRRLPDHGGRQYGLEGPSSATEAGKMDSSLITSLLLAISPIMRYRRVACGGVGRNAFAGTGLKTITHQRRGEKDAKTAGVLYRLD